MNESQEKKCYVFFRNWCEKLSNSEESLLKFQDKLNEFCEPETSENFRLFIHSCQVLREMIIWHELLVNERNRYESLLEDCELD